MNRSKLIIWNRREIIKGWIYKSCFEIKEIERNPFLFNIHFTLCTIRNGNFFYQSDYRITLQWKLFVIDFIANHIIKDVFLISYVDQKCIFFIIKQATHVTLMYLSSHICIDTLILEFLLLTNSENKQLLLMYAGYIDRRIYFFWLWSLSLLVVKTQNILTNTE